MNICIRNLSYPDIIGVNKALLNNNYDTTQQNLKIHYVTNYTLACCCRSACSIFALTIANALVPICLSPSGTPG